MNAKEYLVILLDNIRMVLFDTLNPFKSLSYFDRNYQALFNNSNFAYRKRIATSYFYIVMFRHAFFYCLPKNFPEEYRILFYDHHYILHMRPIINLIGISITWVLLKIHLEIFKPLPIKLYEICIAVICRMDTNFFRIPKNDFSNENETTTTTNNNKKTTSTKIFEQNNDDDSKMDDVNDQSNGLLYCHKVRRLARIVFLNGQLFFPLIYLNCLFQHYYIFRFIYNNCWEFFFNQNQILLSFIRIVIMEFNLLFTTSSYFVYATIFVHIITLLITFTAMIVLRFRQNDQYLFDNVISKFQNTNNPQKQQLMTPTLIRNVYIFMQIHTSTVNLVNKYNKSTGKLFVYYLISHLMQNIFFLMTLIVEKRQTSADKAMFLILVSQQFFGLFGFHLICTYYSKTIHNVGIPNLMSANIKFKSRTLKSQLHISHYIQMFHTKNRYGITYNKFGLITLQSFMKVGLFKLSFFIQINYLFISFSPFSSA